jgi:hypothetical protein
VTPLVIAPYPPNSLAGIAMMGIVVDYVSVAIFKKKATE